MVEPVIDTHVHIWDLSRAEYPWLKDDRSILNRTYVLSELEPERLQTNIVAGVLVQAAGNLEDTELMMEVAKQNSWIKGVVAWLPLMNPVDTRRLLEENPRRTNPMVRLLDPIYVISERGLYLPAITTILVSRWWVKR